MRIEDKLKNNGWKEAVKDLTLPEQMKEALTGQCKESGKKVNYKLRYAKLIPAACMLFILATASMTAHAVYMNTHLRVFFEQDITREQLAGLEDAIKQTEGVSSCRYVSADDAWREFSEAYLTPELTGEFEVNPLADCTNFEIGVSLKADVAELKAYIEELDGVRRVSHLWEGQ